MNVILDFICMGPVELLGSRTSLIYRIKSSCPCWDSNPRHAQQPEILNQMSYQPCQISIIMNQKFKTNYMPLCRTILYITTQSVTSPRNPHYSMMPIVTFTFNLLPPKSIEFTLSTWLTYLTSLMKKHKTVESLLCSQA